MELVPQELDTDKLNECLLIGLILPQAQEIVDKTFTMIGEFTNKHWTKESDEFLLKSDISINNISRGTVVAMMIDDLHHKLFEEDIPLC